MGTTSEDVVENEVQDFSRDITNALSVIFLMGGQSSEAKKSWDEIVILPLHQRWNRVSGSATLAGSGRVTVPCVRPGV